MRKFNKILVANRGEIALRVMRTAKALGYKTVAIYSEADAEALHVRFADDAVLIGPAPVGQSYLDPERILKAAKDAGADAIHPGYGFLSENAEFARSLESAGLVFIGPPAEAIDLMGNKAAAKRHMIAAEVPCVPGYEGTDQSDLVLLAEAKKIGMPVMVKAAAGGGGRGMRLVENADDMQDAINSARSEALNAFGSDELILEKAVMRPRHVEIQVFADEHGNVIHLGERDCSVQRRHQKVLEEAPCPVMTDDLRQRMGEAAVNAAQSINYRGAGTVEFLLSEEGAFYFLEMNTRLQVEHPVTEMVTGLDLVELQIQVAEGLPLDIEQDYVELAGHSIEARIYAEDTAAGFLPSTGKIELWHEDDGEGVRYDGGIESGLEVSPFYDPMIAKVITWGETRELARARLIEALGNTVVFGPSTNTKFLIDALSNPVFAGGEATTAFIADEFGEEGLSLIAPSLDACAIAAVLQYHTEQTQALGASVAVSPELMNWSSGGLLATAYKYSVGDGEIDLSVSPDRDGIYRVKSGDETVNVELGALDGCQAEMTVNGRRRSVYFLSAKPGELYLQSAGLARQFRNLLAFPGAGDEASGGGNVVAPMHGTLLEVLVAAGDEVEKGDKLAVLEAMKMQHDILAEIDGTVSEVLASAGKQAAADDLLMQIEPKD